MARVTTAPLLFIALLASSCQYAQDRGLDFLDQYRVTVGVGPMGGVRSKNLGLIDTGIMVGVKPHRSALGWRYGRPLFFQASDPRFDIDQAEVIKTTSIVDFDHADGSYRGAKTSAAVLPALFSWIDSTPRDYRWRVPRTARNFNDRHWIWGGESFAGSRYAQIHAFDIEVEIGLFVYLGWGYSPGELLDFVLGIFTLDIAQDDGRYRR